MGLDIVPLVRDSEQRVSFSYTGFGEFRRRLAAHIGIELDAMDGFGGTQEWPDPKDEPLVHLLNHSDCDGSLKYEACSALAPRLRELVPLVFPKDAQPGDDTFIVGPHYRAHGLQLGDLCAAVERGDYEELRFS